MVFLRVSNVIGSTCKCIQREYEELKVRINGLVAKARKIPDEGWVMKDGTPWPGNNVCDHPGMIQVCPSVRSAYFLH